MRSRPSISREKHGENVLTEAVDGIGLDVSTPGRGRAAGLARP